MKPSLRIAMGAAVVLSTATASIAQTTLIAVSPFAPTVYVIDTSTYTNPTAITTTVAGFTITGLNSVVRNPANGLLYVIYKATGNARRLGTINIPSGVITDVGNLGDNFSSLTFNGNGTLLGVTGDGATVPETVYRINTLDASRTLLTALGNGADGEVICYNPDDNLVYHWSGNGTVVFEKFDTSGTLVTDIPLSGTTSGETFGAVYTGNGIFITSNINSTFNTFSTTGAVGTAFGVMPDDVRGMGFQINTPLPVVFISFTGVAGKEGNELHWTVASAKADAVFEIQHSSDGRQYNTAGFVSAPARANSATSYRFVHKPSANRNYYRIRQIDADGKSQYSNIITIEQPVFANSSLYPNPITDILHVPGIPAASAYTIYNVAGKILQSGTYDGKTIMTARLAAGTYLLNIAGQSYRFVKK